MIEKWKPVPGFPPYEISNFGNVANGKTGKPLVPWQIKTGHLIVGLYKDRKRYKMQVGMLVALVFIGPKQNDKIHTRHIDGNPMNNRLDNLEYGTASDNAFDKRKHGTIVNGEACNFATIDEALAKKIKIDINEGLGITKTARKHNVSYSLVNHIARGSTWIHVDPPIAYRGRK